MSPTAANPRARSSSCPRAGALLALLTLCASSACRSTDVALLDRNGLEVRERPPATFRIGVLPARLEAQGLATQSQFRLATADGAAFTDLLVAELRAMNAATEVRALPPEDQAGDQLLGLDLVFAPEVRQVAFTEDSTRIGKAVVSTGLWLFTWVGGWFIDDKEFRTGLRIETTVRSVNDRSLAATVDVTELESGPLDLTFFERNAAWTTGFFGSLFLPPWAIGSGFERTSETLTRRSATHLAARWKVYLLEELESRQAYRLWPLDRANGSRVGPTLDLELGLSTLDVLAAVVAQVNDFELDPEALVFRQVSGDSASASTEYRISLSGLPMAAGENLVRLGLGFANGAVHWRTFRFEGEGR
jgi:hypothetical protein